MTADAFACVNLNCKILLTDPLETCELRHCPFVFQRRREQDQARAKERDRREREDHTPRMPGKSLEGKGKKPTMGTKNMKLRDPFEKFDSK